MRRRDLFGLIALAALPGMLSATGAHASGEAKKRTGGENYVSFNTLTGTMNRGGGRRGILTVDCGLDVPDAKLREFANQSLPRLRAAYVQVVLTYAAGMTGGGPPNPDVIAQALQRQTDLVLGRPGAKLLIGAVVAN
jgi:hypothetical protein